MVGHRGVYSPRVQAILPGIDEIVTKFRVTAKRLIQITRGVENKQELTSQRTSTL